MRTTLERLKDGGGGRPAARPRPREHDKESQS